MFRVVFQFGIVVTIALLPVVMLDSLPATPPGKCGCAVVGDPVVTFYDKPGTALVSGTNSYILSLALPNGNGYHCGFVYVLTNYKPHADSQLIVPKGVQIILTGNGTTSCFVSKYGVWNSAVASQWVAYPTNFTDGLIKVSGDIDSGFVLEPEDASCKIQFYAKIDDERTVSAAFVDKAQYSQQVAGICGNCNDILDEYDGLPDSDSPDNVIRVVTPNFVRDSTAFPPDPTP